MRACANLAPMTVALLALMLGAGCGTSDSPERSMTTTNKDRTPMYNVAEPETVTGPVTFDLGAGCKGGLRGTHDDVAMLSITRTGDGEQLHGSVRHDLPRGALIAACGKFFRIVDVKATDSIVFDKKPVPPPTGVAFRADSLVLPAGGQATMGELIFAEVAPDKGKASLKLGVRKGTGVTASATYQTIEVKPGDVVGDTVKHRVLTVVAPDPAQGIPGWVEIDTRAL